MAKTTMSSSREGETLSLRLRTLRSFYSNQKHIWDIGCDHGLLGLSFEAEYLVESIQLVDPSLSVIDKLNDKLKDSYITKHVFIHHKKGQDIELHLSSNCIFIAGMGGSEIGEILTNLLPQLDDSSEIIISPHRKILELRKALGNMPLSIKEEKVIFEDQQFYPVMVLVPGDRGEKVSLYGDALWDDETGEEYLDHQIRYFSHHRDEASLAYVAWLKKRKFLKISTK